MKDTTSGKISLSSLQGSPSWTKQRSKTSKPHTHDEASILKSTMEGIYFCMEWIDTEEGPEYWLTVYEKLYDRVSSLPKKLGT